MSKKNIGVPSGTLKEVLKGTRQGSLKGSKHHDDCEEECVELPVVKIKSPCINIQPPAVKFDKCIQVCDGIALNGEPTPASGAPTVKCDCDLEGAKCYEKIGLCVLEGDKVDITYAVTTKVLNEGTVSWRATLEMCNLDCDTYYAVASQLQYSFDQELDKCAECDYDEESTVNRWITIEQVDREVYAEKSSITVCITGHSELDCKKDWNNAWFRIAVLVGNSEECEENLSVYAATKPVKSAKTGTGFGNLVIEDGDLQFPVCTTEDKTKCYTKRVSCDSENPIVNTATLVQLDGDNKTTIDTQSTTANIGCSTVVIKNFTVTKTCEVSNNWKVTKTGTLIKPGGGGDGGGSCGCVHSLGYWKTHGPDFSSCSCHSGNNDDDWPKNDPNDPNGTIIIIGDVQYTNEQICQLLNIGKKGCDARSCKCKNSTTHLNNLVRQLVATILNGIKNNKNGVPCYPSQEVSDTIDLANALIKAKYPNGIDLSVETCPVDPDLDAKPASTYTGILDDYNTGRKGDPDCDEPEQPELPEQPLPLSRRAPTNLNQKINSKFFRNKRKTFGSKTNLKVPQADDACAKTYAQFTIIVENEISDLGCTVTPKVELELDGCGPLAYDKEFEWVLKQEGIQVDSGCFTLKAGENFKDDSVQFHWIDPANVSDGDEFEFEVTWSNQAIGLSECCIIDLGSEGSISATTTATSETSGESSAVLVAGDNAYVSPPCNEDDSFPVLPDEGDTTPCGILVKNSTFIKCGSTTIDYSWDNNVNIVKDIITNLYNQLVGVSLPLDSTVCSPSTTYQFTYVIEFKECFQCLKNSALVSWNDGNDTSVSEADIGDCGADNNNPTPLAAPLVQLAGNLSIPNQHQKQQLPTTTTSPAKSTGCSACEKKRLERNLITNVNSSNQPAQPIALPQKSVPVQTYSASKKAVNTTRSINRFGRTSGRHTAKSTKSLKK